MTAARRYAFDTEFDAAGAVVREGARTRSYAPEEVEQERAAAFAAGRDDAVARAQAQTAQAAAAIATAAQGLAASLAAERRAMLKDAAGLAMAAARAAAGAALDRFGAARVEAALDAAFEEFIGAPRVVVRLSPALQDLRAALEAIAAGHGFEGALVVRADPAVRQGDVTLDWGEGAVIHDAGHALARMEALVTDALARETAGGVP